MTPPPPTRQPYLVASRHGAAGGPGTNAASGPFARFDPQLLESERFLDLVERLAAVIHATSAFPRWAIYDCVEVPGAVVGLALAAGAAPAHVRETLEVPDGWDGLVPVSMVAAAPMVEAGAWHLYGLGGLEDTAAQTLDLAITALGIHSVVGSTAWRSPDLGAHLRLGPLEVIAAWTPAHTDPATLTYRAEIDGGPAREAAATTSITCSDDDALRDLQAEVEAGARYRVAGTPDRENGDVRVLLEAVNP